MRILLVDDETSVLQALMGTLRGLDGHEVKPAISAEKALANAVASVAFARLAGMRLAGMGLPSWSSRGSLMVLPPIGAIKYAHFAF